MYGGSAPDPSGVVAMPDGRGYLIESAAEESMVTPALAAELKCVLEAFAAGAGFDERHPVGVTFRRGIFGHHRLGRAADIYAVGGVGMDTWKARWDRASRAAAAPGGEGARAVEAERQTNLGWQLYKTMADRGRWSQPYGYPIQLFGPWTRTEGPWKYISDRLLHAHRDHIHAAK